MNAHDDEPRAVNDDDAREWWELAVENDDDTRTRDDAPRILGRYAERADR